MVIIKMTGEATEEKDTRKFFMCQEDGEHEIDRETAGCSCGQEFKTKP